MLLALPCEGQDAFLLFQQIVVVAYFALRKDIVLNVQERGCAQVLLSSLCSLKRAKFWCRRTNCNSETLLRRAYGLHEADRLPECWPCCVRNAFDVKLHITCECVQKCCNLAARIRRRLAREACQRAPRAYDRFLELFLNLRKSAVRTTNEKVNYPAYNFEFRTHLVGNLQNA